MLDEEEKGYFKIEQISTNATAFLYTTDIPIDREDPDIFQNGGVYSFNVRAIEMINGQFPADFSLTQVTIVITDGKKIRIGTVLSKIRYSIKKHLNRLFIQTYFLDETWKWISLKKVYNESFENQNFFESVSSFD